MNLSYWFGHKFFREVARGFFDFRVIGEERLNFDGPALIASNHVSFLDPPFIGQAFSHHIHYFARKTLFDHPIAGAVLRSWHTVPIDRDKPDASSLKTTIRILRQGGKVLIFPEGTRSPDGQPGKAEAGVGLFIAKTGVPVLPIRLYGTYEAFPRGAAFLRPARVTLVVGERYQPDLQSRNLEGRDLYQSLSDEVMDHIRQITL